MPVYRLSGTSGASSVYSTNKTLKKNGNGLYSNSYNGKGLYLNNRGSEVTKKKVLKKEKN